MGIECVIFSFVSYITYLSVVDNLSRIFHGRPTYNFIVWILGGNFEGRAILLPRNVYEYPFITFADETIISNADWMSVSLFSMILTLDLQKYLALFMMGRILPTLYSQQIRRATLGVALLPLTIQVVSVRQRLYELLTIISIPIIMKAVTMILL